MCPFSKIAKKAKSLHPNGKVAWMQHRAALYKLLNWDTMWLYLNKNGQNLLHGSTFHPSIPKYNYLLF